MPKAKLQAIDRPLDRDHILRELTTPAERFVNKAWKHQRTAVERQTLLDAIVHAQLVVSVSKPKP